MKTVLFAGGGTGGHLMPALAIAEAMVRLDPSISPLMVGGFRGVEARVLPARPWRHMLLPFEPIYRRRWWRNARLPLSLARTISGVRRLLREQQPVLAVGTGGYVAGPVMWAAAASGVPVVIQEQNAFPGLATRMLARRARQIHLGFPEAEALLSTGPRTTIRYSGNPISRPPGVSHSRAAAKHQLGFAADQAVVLIVGGSQGAAAINSAVSEAVTSGLWPEEVQIYWQTGEPTFERFRQLATTTRRIAAFIDPISDAYAAADVVVGRAGAMTLAELAAWGMPSILIPYPHAAAGHQLANARAIVAAGAGILIEQADLSARTLSDQVRSLLHEPARMARLSAAMLRRARPEAATEIARAAMELVA